MIFIVMVSYCMCLYVFSYQKYCDGTLKQVISKSVYYWKMVENTEPSSTQKFGIWP